MGSEKGLTMHNTNILETYGSKQRTTGSPCFYLTLLYLLFEYARPQSITDVSHLHLPAVMVIILAVALVFSRGISLSDRQTGLFISLLALMALHIPLASNNYWALQNFRAMLLTFVAYLSVITFINSLQRFMTLINVWLAVHFYLAVIGIIRGGKGIGGFLFDENDLCMTMNMIIPFAFFSVMAEKSAIKKAVYVLLTILFILTNVMTFSRGGFIGLAAVCIYCLIRSPRKLVSAVLVTLLIFSVLQYAPEKYWDRIQSIQKGSSDSTGESRVFLWKLGLDIFLDNPVIGIGQGNFPFRSREYEIAAGFEEGLDGTSRSGKVAHSLYITLLSELGLIGALLFFAMLYSNYKDTFSIRNALRGPADSAVSGRGKTRLLYLSYALEASLIGYLASGIFITVTYYPNFWLLTGFIVSMRRITERAGGSSA